MNKDRPSCKYYMIYGNILRFSFYISALLTDIDSSEQTESNPHIDDKEHCLYDSHDQKLEGVELAYDHPEGDEN